MFARRRYPPYVSARRPPTLEARLLGRFTSGRAAYLVPSSGGGQDRPKFGDDGLARVFSFGRRGRCSQRDVGPE